MLYEDFKLDCLEQDPVEILDRFNITTFDLIERFEDLIEAAFYEQETQEEYYDYEEEDE